MNISIGRVNSWPDRKCDRFLFIAVCSAVAETGSPVAAHAGANRPGVNTRLLFSFQHAVRLHGHAGHVHVQLQRDHTDVDRLSGGRILYFDADKIFADRELRILRDETRYVAGI